MSDHKDESTSTGGPVPLHGLLAQYGTPWQLIGAFNKVREARYQRWDTYAPFPVHGIDKAMGILMTILPWIVLFWRASRGSPAPSLCSGGRTLSIIRGSSAASRCGASRRTCRSCSR